MSKKTKKIRSKPLILSALVAIFFPVFAWGAVPFMVAYHAVTIGIPVLILAVGLSNDGTHQLQVIEHMISSAQIWLQEDAKDKIVEDKKRVMIAGSMRIFDENSESLQKGNSDAAFLIAKFDNNSAAFGYVKAFGSMHECALAIFGYRASGRILTISRIASDGLKLFGTKTYPKGVPLGSCEYNTCQCIPASGAI